MTWKFEQIDQVWDNQSKKLEYLIDVQSNLGLWCLTHLKVDLFDNQIKIVDSIIDLNCKYILLAASRSSGKTFSVSVGIIKLCIDHAPFSVGVFAPKFDQASRLLKQVKDILKNSSFEGDVIWEECTQNKLVFRNGSSIVSNSASEVSNVEGIHVDCLVIDEAHKVSDLSISQKLLPMAASSRVGKIIKLGVPLYKNHFWRSYNDPQYTRLIFDFTQAPNLLKGGSIVVKGKEYSRYVVDTMPLQIKQTFFPDNPELWINTSDTSDIDFKTQYLMQWVEDLNLVLSDQDQQMLFSGPHSSLQSGYITETYFAGLDTAGGSQKGISGDTDFTSLSIWRKTVNQIKEKVAHYEWRGDITAAINEIYDIINPQTGKFRCVFTVVDYSNIGINLVESYKKLGVPIEGITFGATERNSGKNFKNAMIEQFLFELRAGRLRYPKEDTDKLKILKKAQTEWCLMERHTTLGINAKYGVPEKEGHDDTVCSDILGIWSADRYTNFLKSNSVAVSMQLPGAVHVNSAMNAGAGSSPKPWWVLRDGFGQ